MQETLAVAFTTDEGIEIKVPIPLHEMSQAEKAAFLKFHSSQDVKTLTADEQSLLANRKVYLRGEGVVAGLICRFDWHPWAI